MPDSPKLFNPDSLTEIKTKKKAWQQQAFDGQKKQDAECHTLSAIPVKPLYTPEDLSSLNYNQDLGFPGEEPFVRGVYPSMYRGRGWTLRQLAGFGTAEKTNERYKFLLEEGATGINGVFDYPTLRGFDSTEPMARADAGRGGVATSMGAQPANARLMAATIVSAADIDLTLTPLSFWFLGMEVC